MISLFLGILVFGQSQPKIIRPEFGTVRAVKWAKVHRFGEAKPIPLVKGDKLYYRDLVKLSPKSSMAVAHWSKKQVIFTGGKEPDWQPVRDRIDSAKLKHLGQRVVRSAEGEIQVLVPAGHMGAGDILWPQSGASAALFAIEVEGSADQMAEVSVEQSGVLWSGKVNRSIDGLFHAPEAAERLVADGYRDSPVNLTVGDKKTTFLLMPKVRETKMLAELAKADLMRPVAKATWERARILLEYGQIALARAELRMLGTDTAIKTR